MWQGKDIRYGNEIENRPPGQIAHRLDRHGSKEKYFILINHMILMVLKDKMGMIKRQ